MALFEAALKNTFPIRFAKVLFLATPTASASRTSATTSTLKTEPEMGFPDTAWSPPSTSWLVF